MQAVNTFEVERYSRELRLRIDDMPIGDPMSGAAYGEKLKSKGLGMIVGVVASVMTMGAALPMMASTALATQIAGGAMFAGGALTGIGTLTGNKKLTKIGGVLSLAGGLGGLASNALGGAGVGGVFAPGSGSTALQKMAGGMMDSVNSIGGKIGLGNIYDADKVSAAMRAGDGASAATSAASAPAVEVAPLEGAASTSAQAGAPTLELQAGGDTGLLNKGLKAPSIDVGYNLTGGGPAVQTPGGALPAGGAGAASQKGIIGRTFDWMKDNAELTKTAAGMLEKGIAAAMAPDEEAKLAAMAAQYGAQAELLKTQQEVLEYRKNNMSKQVAMISAGDPDAETKVKQAAANGVPVVFIPNIGSGGVTQSGGSWNNATANLAPQTPARQATFGQQPQPQQA